MQLLNKAALGWLVSSSSTSTKYGEVGVPKYDPTDLSPGILHIGVGNFFRAHMASYLDQLFNEDIESHKDWGIIGAGVTNGSYSKRKKALESQDMLYTLVERDGQGSKARVVGSLMDLLPYDPNFVPKKDFKIPKSKY